MGNCCGSEEEDRPLLQSGPVGARSGTLSTPSVTPVSPVRQPPVSARQHRPVDHRDFETSIELIATLKLKSLPLPALDKTFKDIGKLYNEVVESFRSLETDIHKFKEYFVEETAGIPVLATCVKILVKRCGVAKINIERKTGTFIEVTYDTKEVTKYCKGAPESVLDQLNHFKSAGRHIKNVLEHAPQVQTNTAILLNDEQTLRKDILKADLSAQESQEALRAFLDNVSKLRTMAAGTDTLKRDVEKKFKEYSKASEGFFVENEL